MQSTIESEAFEGLDREAYRACRLCPRACGVDRTAGRRGICGETAVCRLAQALPHFGEEPSFSGTHGSGTLFFSGCACRCFFCQNAQISLEGSGETVAPESLFSQAAALVRRGVHNLNFVTADHFWPHVEAVCRRLRAAGVTIPFLLNTSGYVRAELVPRYARVIRIFLPDFKFSEAGLAQKCMGARDYPDVALQALHAMVAAAGFLEPWDPGGRRPAERGVLVRHLILPGAVDNSLGVLRRLHAAFGPDLPLSVMSQFQPTEGCRARGLLLRRPHKEEIERVHTEIEALGFTRVYIQPAPTGGEYLPDFDRHDPFPGNQSRERSKSSVRGGD